MKTSDGSAIPPAAKLTINGESQTLASAAGSPTNNATLELPAGPQTCSITNTAPYADVQNGVEILSNDVVRVTVTLVLLN